MHWMDGSYMWFGWFFWLILLGVIVWFVYFIANKNRNSEPRESSLDILKKRFAKGEISSEQYEEMKNTLKA